MGRHAETSDSVESASLGEPQIAASASPPLTRRELRHQVVAAEGLTAAQTSADVAAPRSSAPRLSAPRSSAPRSSRPLGKVARTKPRLSTRLFTVTAMVFVAAMAVATSVPANALLSAQVVEAPKTVHPQGPVNRLASGQSIEASGATVVAGRDSVSVSGAEPVKAYTDVSSNRITPLVPNSTGPILWPFPKGVPLTDGFGPRAGIWTYGGYTGNFHSGQDFDPGYGTPIQSVADGIVTEVSSNLCGTAVVIAHNVNNEKFDSEYCHMVYGSTTVTVGQSVKAGAVIGNVGQTGMATGPHLHLEIHVGGNAIDPLGFLRARSTEW